MNLIVYVSDALRTDHVGCYGARRVRTPTIDEFARGAVRFDQAIAAAPWTAPSTASMVTGLYPHHHRYLHWDAELDPALPTLFTVAAAYGYETGSFVFDESYLFKGFADANVAGTSERLDGAVEWLSARRDRPFCLWFHSWATHMPYDVHHAERKEWRAAKDAIIAGHPGRQRGRARGAARGLRPRRRATVGDDLRRVPRGPRRPRPPRADRDRLRQRPRRVVGRALCRQERREGHVPHARRDALRRGRRGAADPRRPGPRRAGRRRGRRSASST